MLLKELVGHEGGLRAILLVDIRCAELLQRGILAYGHAGEVKHQFLSAAVLDTHRVLVYRHGERAGGVLDDHVLIDVARCVRRDHTAFEQDVLAILTFADCLEIVFGVLPVFFLDLGDGHHVILGGILEPRGGGRVQRGVIKVVLARCHGQGAHEEEAEI